MGILTEGFGVGVAVGVGVTVGEGVKVRVGVGVGVGVKVKVGVCVEVGVGVEVGVPPSMLVTTILSNHVSEMESNPVVALKAIFPLGNWSI